MAGRVVLHLGGRVQPGRLDDLLAFLAEAVPFYERPGGITVSLLTGYDDPEEFIEVVEYADDRTYEADQRRVESDPEMRGYLDRWRALLTGPPRVTVYRDRTGAG
jgi:hypothetical protein